MEGATRSIRGRVPARSSPTTRLLDGGLSGYKDRTQEYFVNQRRNETVAICGVMTRGQSTFSPITPNSLAITIGWHLPGIANKSIM
jgi:hypothetical protein